jgi:serine/threonine-protein kinase RsbT
MNQLPDLKQTEIPIESESDIIEVRQFVRQLAQTSGFDSFSLAALITAASELSRNVWTHAGSGRALISMVSHLSRQGMRLEFIDEGPGILDLDSAMAGGRSTKNSLGLGLSGTKRLVDDFQIESKPGQGTRVVVQKWKT